MALKTWFCALWLDVLDEEGYPHFEVLKHPKTISCGDTLEFKIVVTRTDLQALNQGPKKAFGFKVKIP